MKAASPIGQKLLLLCTTWLGMALNGHAELLVYDGFNYGTVRTSGQSMAGVSVSASTVGLQGTYAQNTDSSALPTYFDSTGLTFGSNFLSTEGGALKISVTTGKYSILGVQLNAGTVTGDLYQSFLYNFSTNASVVTGKANFTRLTTAQTASTNEHFSVGGEAKAAGTGSGISYNDTGSSVGGANVLTANTTYLFLAKFTNVGLSLSSSNPATATLWVLDLNSYDAWLSAGSAEDLLSTYALTTATDTQTSGTWTFNDTSFLQFAATSSAVGSGTFTGLYDELRMGTTLSDVVVVPEPSTGLLVLGGVAALFGLKRMRRQKTLA